MLGRMRRTTRLDVGLAMSFAGISFLLWALVAGASRTIMLEVIRSRAHLAAEKAVTWPRMTEAVKIFFVDTGFVIDIVGLCWMVLSLVLIVLANRQKISISWAWVSAIFQSFIAALGAVLVGWMAYNSLALYDEVHAPTVLETLSQISLPVVIVLAILVWVSLLVWLLVERARLDRHGPTLTDGLRTNR